MADRRDASASVDNDSYAAQTSASDEPLFGSPDSATMGFSTVYSITDTIIHKSLDKSMALC